MKIGFDNEKYLKIQSEHIRERIGKFGNKLYLEESSLTTITQAVFCRVFVPTVSCRCLSS